VDPNDLSEEQLCENISQLLAKAVELLRRESTVPADVTKSLQETFDRIGEYNMFLLSARYEFPLELCEFDGDVTSEDLSEFEKFMTEYGLDNFRLELAQWGLKFHSTRDYHNL